MSFADNMSSEVMFRQSWCPGPESNRYPFDFFAALSRSGQAVFRNCFCSSLYGSHDSKLSPSRGASEPRSQMPGEVEGSHGEWCPGPESNRYVSFETRDFKSRASASFATRARPTTY